MQNAPFFLFHKNVRGDLLHLWILLRRNIPLRANSICILSISLERIELLNLATLIQVSTKAFWHSYTWNLKHLRTCKWQIFITTYYLQDFRHCKNLKLKLVYFFINEVGHWCYRLDHVIFSKNVFLPVNLVQFFYQIFYVIKSTLWLV